MLASPADHLQQRDPPPRGSDSGASNRAAVPTTPRPSTRDHPNLSDSGHGSPTARPRYPMKFQLDRYCSRLFQSIAREPPELLHSNRTAATSLPHPLLLPGGASRPSSRPQRGTPPPP